MSGSDGGSLGASPFVTGSARVDTQQMVRRLTELTRGRASMQQLPALAARLLGTSSAHVAFLPETPSGGTQVVHGGVGLSAASVGVPTPAEESMCSVTVAGRAPTAIDDARADPRVATMPPVASGLVRSYLGVPLEVRGLVVGALCVFDGEPRHWTDEDADLLVGLAGPIVAELELAAVALEHEDERVLWQLAVDAAEVGAFDWYLESDELRWDDRLLEIFGLDATTFEGTIGAFNETVHPDDRARVGQALQLAIETCGLYEAEYRIVRPDGQVRWVNARGRALPGPDGAATRVVGAAFDTTAAVEGDVSVRRVLEAMPSAFFHLDPDWRFSYVNAEAAALLGGVSRDLVGGNVWELFPEAVGSDFERFYRQAAATGRPVHFEAYYPPPLDTWYDVRAWPTPEGLSVYFADATDRRRVQQLVERSRDRAELLAAVSDALTGTLQPQGAAAQLARVVAPLADWSIVSLVDQPGRGEAADWRRGLHDTAGWHADPEARTLVQSYLRVRVAALTDDSVVARALRDAQPVVVDVGRPGERERTLLAGGARDLVASLDPGPLAVLPLRARGRTLGLLTVARDRGAPAFDESDVDLLGEIAARAGLALDNARLYADQRDLAEQLQRSLLTRPPTPSGLEIAVRYVPAASAAQVGGDWYDAFDCHDGATVVVIGDVVGHDTAAAAAMGQLRGLVRGIAVSTEGGPAAVLGAVDRAMDTLRLETLATAVVARLEPADPAAHGEAGGTAGFDLVWANAGHPPPLVVRPDGSSHRLTEGQLLLGLEPGTDRADARAHLPPGSVAVLYTDGLVERRDQAVDDGLDALQGLLDRLVAHGVALEPLCDRLLADLLPPAPEDDVALVVVRVL